MIMVKIYVDNEALDLPASFALDIEDSSPIFNDRGSQSVPVAVPVTPRNSRLLGFPQHLYTAKDPNKGTLASVTCGIYGRTGSLNITEAGPGTISFNIGFDNSVAYQKWAAKSLADLTLPVRTYTDVNAAILSMSVLYRNSDPAHNDLAVFPVLLAKEDVDGVSYPTALNIPSGSAFFNPGEIKAVVDGTVKDVTVPAGYGISPFLRVWRLVELVFADLGLTVISNPMKSDRELARLVVLNNTMDTICGAKVDYRDLVPDCTVEEFMNALWVRFGLVYNIDWTKGTVEIRLLDDILKSRPVTSLDEFMSERPSVTYESPRYVKLSAATSIEGAEPDTERFEDFSSGADTDYISTGDNVAAWKYDTDSNRWDGDVRDDYIDDADLPEEPDPDEPEIQDSEDDTYSDSNWVDAGEWDWDGMDDARSYAPAKTTTEQGSDCYLASEFVSCRWYRLDKANGRTKEASSPFFVWDPQPEGHEALELTSVDECVPVGPLYYQWYEGSTRKVYSAPAPDFRTGARFRHSYIKGSDNKDSDSSKSPLAFMQAYTLKDMTTIGRLHPLDETGRPYPLADGSTPTLSLLFHFSDGLFARYWKRYDEILRHAKRKVSVSLTARPHVFSGLPMLAPVALRSVPCLLDRCSYSITGRERISADVTLRPLYTQGSYSYKTEQPIPDFLPRWKNLAWRLRRDDLSEIAKAEGTRQRAADTVINDLMWRPHDGFTVTASTVYLRTTERITRWTDAGLDIPVREGQISRGTCRAAITYEVYEENAGGNENPLGDATVEVYYHVEVVARIFR